MFNCRIEDACYFRNSIPEYLYWQCPSGNDWLDEFISNEHAWIWLIWLLSQVDFRARLDSAHLASITI